MKKFKKSISTILVAATIISGTSVVTSADGITNTARSFGPNLAASTTTDLDTSVPPALLDTLPEGAVISGYNAIDTGVNPDATVTFVDPLRAGKAEKPNSYAGDRRVYVKTQYAIGKLSMVQSSTGPINNQKFIVSVARGHTNTASTAVTVSGSLQLAGTYNVNVVNLVKPH
ncbi:hypothetical protein [Paenibacillus montanisoli]|uniref:hypothetical protein n=1 Tax=Paenibacillus montanisoli TaxID=2081970 RepID=UPI0010578173|nr:hypothetical protein [Paenibacillus montanisoli]